MSWEQVRDLESLAKINWEIAEDALDDAVDYLQQCSKRLDKAQKGMENIKDEGNNLGCIGYPLG